MKRQSSPTEPETKPDLITSPSPVPGPKSKKTKSSPTKSSPTKSLKSKPDADSPSKSKPKFDITGDKMEWNADGREALIDYLIAEGLKGKDKALLAGKFGVTKQKIHNELSLGRVGNMRSKASKAVRD